MKYPVGTKLFCNNIEGVVVDDVKIHGDICVQWDEIDFVCSYDERWLDENAIIMKDSDGNAE